MTTDAQAFAQLHKLAPAEAAAYLMARGQLAVTYGWEDLWQEEHARQFTISRLTRTDLLQALQDKITASVQGDLSRRDFLRDARAALAEAGWWGKKEVVEPATGEIHTTRFNPSRLNLIFDVNTRQAHAAGQWERMQRTKRTHPYLRYITKRDERVREAHRACDNVTLPIDDAFWQTHCPPNGWRCRCRVVAVSQAEYDRGVTPTGAPMVKTVPAVVMRDWLNKRTGEVMQVPAGIDPGFGYNAGAARQRALSDQAVIGGKLENLAAPLAVAAIRDLTSSPTFSAWLQQPVGNFPVARLTDEVSMAMGASAHVVHLSAQTAKKQFDHHPEIDAADYARVQHIIDSAQTRLPDGPHSTVFVWEAKEPGGWVVVVKATRTGKGLFLTSMRRLSRQQAQADAEIQRLIQRFKKR
ncbi:MAG: phage minor head protein [Roseateles sp.]|uniref:phage head morphogenesis protein n=1 Tax=Roseateles sp. TaxID=1971397 RepID=UPI0039EBDB2C